MKTLSFKSLCLSCAVTLGLAISVEVANAETIYIGTGTPVTSTYNVAGKNVTGTVTDANHDGYADARMGGSNQDSDPTNKRDVNWQVTYTDAFASEYTAYMGGDSSAINRRRSAVEKKLADFGATKQTYIQTHTSHGANTSYVGSTGAKALGTVYSSTAELLGNISMNQGGLSNFAVGSSGVITTFGGAYFDEAGQYEYVNNTPVYNGNHSTHSTTGFVPVQSGIVAFTTSFTKNAATAAFQYINGTFAVLGELLGIYVNGNLLNASQYTLGEDMITTGYAHASQHEFEIDLDSIASMLVDGNNNLSFMVMGIPRAFDGIGGYTYADSMSFIHLSAGISQNTESIFGGGGNGGDGSGNGGDGGGNGGNGGGGSETPEPATLLIIGMGLAGLGIRRKMMNKKSA